MNALITNTVKKITSNMSDDDLKQAVRKVLEWFDIGDLKKVLIC